ncbi:hypothetical protein AB0M86_48670 [Streptomyces sp. NPDC051639]|uniref:hypothetical protein n=1 Tax=Streptomyces sp. NPDC051639 TaxID=3155671 RepID=UPI00343DA15C
MAGRASKSDPQLLPHLVHDPGTTIDTPHGEQVPPTTKHVLTLGEDKFASVGARFHHTALRAAASHYEQHTRHWQQPDAGELAVALTRISGIGPWTASAAAADFSIYPHHDRSFFAITAVFSPAANRPPA